MTKYPSDLKPAVLDERYVEHVKAVRSLLGELQAHAASGLITREALTIMGRVDQLNRFLERHCPAPEPRR